MKPRTVFPIRVDYCRLALTALAIVIHTRSGAAATPVLPSLPTRSAPDLRKLPLAFEPNMGQSDPAVRFLSHARGITAFFTDTEAVMVLAGRPSSKQPGAGVHDTLQAAVRMKLLGAQSRRPVSSEELAGCSNYLLGDDPAQWRTHIPHFAGIEYHRVYPGIDLVWHGEQQQRLEYDFVVAPGADPDAIQMVYPGVESMRVDADGGLLLRTSGGELRQERPQAFQEVHGRQTAVNARFVIVSGNQVRFELAEYDRKLALRIDPVVMAYSTLVGLNGFDRGCGIAVDAKGDAYVTGVVERPFYPAQSGYQSSLQGGTGDAFVTKLAPTGSTLIYSTYLGGNAYDQGFGVAIDAQGSAYVMGTTQSTNFPTQSAYQAKLQGTTNAFVTKLAPTGDALVYSTYLGSGNTAYLGLGGIAVDAAGAAYVTSDTQSSTFPTQSPYQAKLRGASDAFVAKLAPAGDTLVYSTYLGGASTDQGTAIAVDAAGSAYITGGTGSFNFPTTQSAYQPLFAGGTSDAFVTKLTPAGDALVYSTYLGGTGIEAGTGIAVDSSLSAYITGSTNSTNFPTQSPLQATFQGGNYDAFVAKLAPAGDALTYSTYLGGQSDDFGTGIAVDAFGSAYVAGSTASLNFPTQSASQPSRYGNGNAFVTELSPGGNALVHSTYVGGSKSDGGGAIAVDAAGSAYLTGNAGSPDFPATPSAYQQPIGWSLANLQIVESDVFVTKFLGWNAASANTSCNVKGDVAVDAPDVQTLINEGLGSMMPLHDLNQDGVTNVVDLQVAINASLGLGCSTPL